MLLAGAVVRLLVMASSRMPPELRSVLLPCGRVRLAMKRRTIAAAGGGSRNGLQVSTLSLSCDHAINTRRLASHTSLLNLLKKRKNREGSKIALCNGRIKTVQDKISFVENYKLQNEHLVRTKTGKQQVWEELYLARPECKEQPNQPPKQSVGQVLSWRARRFA